MRKNRKNDSHTRRKRICIAALLLAGSLIPGGCGIKKEKTSDSELPEIVIGIDYFEPYSYQTSDGEYKGIDVELAQRIIDFTSGACYSLGGSLQQVSSYIFVLGPYNVDITGDLQNILGGSVPSVRVGY